MECLADVTVSRFVRGELPPESLARVDEHLAECTECRGVVADVVRSLEGSRADQTRDGRTPAPVPRAPGQRVGRYDILHLLGSGGMGVVYAAQDTVLDRRVALKLIRESGGAGLRNEVAHKQLLLEAQAMAQLSHPNVVSVFDAGTLEGEVFVAMELVDGQTLKEWLVEKPRSLPESLAILVAAGRGLAAAHAARMVHRDFKPENVLVGTDGRVRVTDFGLARPMGAGPPGSALRAGAGIDLDLPVDPGAWSQNLTLTRTGVMKGTLAYMAPEQLRGEPADGRTDQFSFSVAVYTALYGERPFLANTPEVLVREVCAGRVRPAPPGSSVPERLRQVLMRGLSATREARYPSLEALLDALEVSNSPLASRRAKRPVGAMLATLALAALIGAGVFLARRPQSVPPPARVAAAPSLAAVGRSPPPIVAPLPTLTPEPRPGPTGKRAAKIVAATRKRRVRPTASRRRVASSAPESTQYDDSPMEPSFARGAGHP